MPMSRSPIARGQGAYGGGGFNARRPAVQGVSKLLFLVLAQVGHVAAAPLTEYLGQTKRGVMVFAEEAEPSMWLLLGVAAVLVLLGGAFAGLTIA